MKQLLKRLLPLCVLQAYHRYRRSVNRRRNAARTPEQIFSEAYRLGLWGKHDGLLFCSGDGSITPSIVEPYVEKLADFLESLPQDSRRVVDLGCGDFNIGRRLLSHCSSYIGIDVVPDLIQHLKASVIDGRVKFICMDIIDGKLPEADVCLIRQVFQHLSNEQIQKVLVKLNLYQTVFITEHHPADEVRGVPNADKTNGADIRLFDNSGVYLDLPPFNVPSSAMELFVEVPAQDFGRVYHGGVIRTFKLTRNKAPAGKISLPSHTHIDLIADYERPNGSD